MSHSAVAHDPHDIHHDPTTNTGIPNRKLMMWAFLASDCMFFGCLIGTHLVYRLAPPPGTPDPREIFDIELTSLSTFILLLSSLMMFLAVQAISKNNLRSFRNCILVTALFGIAFLVIQGYEFWYFATQKDFTLTGSLFGSTFYTLTGTHKLHVLIGVIWLLTYYFYSYSGKLTYKRTGEIETVGLYWHFVDIVWILIFTVVYLFEWL